MTLAPGARRVLRALAPLTVALVVTACGGTPSATPSGSSIAATPVASSPGTTDEPTAAPATAEPTGVPTEEPSAPSTAEPAASATAEPASPPAPSPTTGAADACTGSAENRAFYAAVADAVDWEVYCPVLPSGWYVDTGSFRLANGGKLEISYTGPVGQRIEIREGAYCTAAGGCVPGAPASGAASFGGRSARLFDLGAGVWLVLAEGDAVGWEAKGLGLDGAALTALAAAFAVVGR